MENTSIITEKAKAILNIASDADMLPERKLEAIMQHMDAVAGETFWSRFAAFMSDQVHLNIIASKSGDTLTVSILPQGKDDDEESNITPLTISGSVQEFGSEFFTAATTRLQEAVGLVVNDAKPAQKSHVKAPAAPSSGNKKSGSEKKYPPSGKKKAETKATPATPEPESDKNSVENQERKCRKCGCTQDNCQQCIEKTGKPCSWVEQDLCSACVEDETGNGAFDKSSATLFDNPEEML